MIAIVRSLSSLFYDNFEGNANISVAIKSSSTVSRTTVELHTYHGTPAHVPRYTCTRTAVHLHTYRQFLQVHLVVSEIEWTAAAPVDDVFVLAEATALTVPVGLVQIVVDE